MSKWEVVDFLNKQMKSGKYRILKKMMHKDRLEIPDGILSDAEAIRRHLQKNGILRDSSPVEIEMDTRIHEGKSYIGYIYVCGMDTGEPLVELHLTH